MIAYIILVVLVVTGFWILGKDILSIYKNLQATRQELDYQIYELEQKLEFEHERITALYARLDHLNLMDN